MPTVSVIMNCHNGEKYLRDAIDSVYAQSYEDWEIVLWDDASVDGTEKIARGYDGKLRYFKGQKAIGLGQARNFALGQAQGDFLAFLDQDDLWLPTKLEKQIPLFDDSAVGLVFSDAIIFNEFGKTSRAYRNQRYATGDCFPQMLADYFLNIETVVIRRAALDTLSMWFEPDFDLCEEADLFTRISLKWRLAFLDEPLAQWRVHAASLTWTRHERSVEEREIMLAKYFKTIPDFAEKYTDQIETFKTSICISKAKNFWVSDKGAEARGCLRPFIFRNWKAFQLFWLTFVREATVGPILSVLRASVFPR